MPKHPPFLLKAGDSTNYQPNDNDPNYKLKSLYNEVKSVWMLKYGKNFFTSPHEFHIGGSMGHLQGVIWKIIRDSFVKSRIHPLSPPNLRTNTQACDVSIQLYYGAKAGKINKISRHIVAPIEKHVTRTNDTMVVLRSKISQQSPKNIFLRAAAYDAVMKLNFFHIQEMNK